MRFTYLVFLKNFYTEIIEIDKQFKGIRIAAFFNPDAVADGTEKLSFDEHTFKLPTLQDLMTLTSKELKKRLRGQNVFTQVTFAAKADRGFTIRTIARTPPTINLC